MQHLFGSNKYFIKRIYAITRKRYADTAISKTNYFSKRSRQKNSLIAIIALGEGIIVGRIAAGVNKARRGEKVWFDLNLKEK